VIRPYDIDQFNKISSAQMSDAKILYKLREIYGDSLYYDQTRKFASASGHIKVIDTLNHMTTTGGYAEYYENKDSVFITQSPVLSRKMDIDTLYIYGDTLLITGKLEERIMRAFHHVKFFKQDMQGACDSLYSHQAGGYTHMLGKPVLWNDNNQISGDTLHFFTNKLTNKLDSLSIIRNAFIINKDSIKGYNQLKGTLLQGKFKDGKLHYVRITGNAESLNYQRDDEKKLIGITHMQSGEIHIRLQNGKVETATYLNSPEGKTYPESKFPNNLKKLKNFLWREEERPENKDDIYPHTQKSPLTGESPTPIPAIKK
jgi:antitoxin component YwqK of YwqJK toxin-antitoxin module